MNGWTRLAYRGLCFLMLLCIGKPGWAWYNNDWRYRVPIRIAAGVTVNSTVKLDVDFASLLSQLGVNGTFDVKSPRIVRSDDTTLVGTQEFTDSIYNASNDNVGNSRGEIRFIVQDAGATTYYLYFDVTSNGVKPNNPQPPINGNFEANATGTLTPSGWAINRSDANMDMQVRPAETVEVTDSSPNVVTTKVSTDGNPNTGQYAYLMGFRTRGDLTAAQGTFARLTKSVTIPASSPGNLTIRFKPQGWDSGSNGDLVNYDYLQVRLLNPADSTVLLNVVGPQMNNYTTCPFSPNYGFNFIGQRNSGFGGYNYWDNALASNHLLSMSSTYNRGKEPWVTCSASLSGVAGRTVTLEIRMAVVAEYRTWFLLDDIEWSVAAASAGSPEALVIPATPSSFNAFDSATASGAVSGVLKTKVAGSAFSFDVVALHGSPPSVLTNFTGAVKVELVSGSGSTSCASRTLIKTVSTSYTFTAAEQGRHRFTNVLEADAYADVLVRIGYPATAPTVFACSTDHFAIRPDRFSLAATDNDPASAGTARILNALTAAATPVHKAGRPFTVTATAYNAGGAVTTNYSGSPIANVESCVLPDTGCVQGVLTAGSFAASNGIAVSNSATYSEVGAIALKVEDYGFAAVDASDGSTLAERTVASSAIQVGRFIPDHFDITLNAPAFAPACGTFGYVGQPVKYATQPVVNVVADSALDAQTKNYTGTLWKISASSIAPSYSEASHSLTVLNSGSPSVADNGDGSGVLRFADTTGNILAIRRGEPEAPFDADIAMSFSLIDSDGVVVAFINGGAGTNPIRFGAASAGNGMAFTNHAKSQRWGRLVMNNAYGSELTPLSLPLFAEYFNGTNFIANTTDQCTTLSLATHLRLSNPATNSGAQQAGTAAMVVGAATSSATLAHPTLSAGDAGLRFSAPGAGNTGYIDAIGRFDSLPWLLFDWDRDGAHDDSPRARASFGLYGGDSSQIYLREIY